MKLLPFQRRFWNRAFASDVTTASLSLPRGSGKSTLAGLMAARAMQTINPHSEIALCAASIEQARIVFRVTRSVLGEDGFRYIDSSTRCGITRSDGARLRVIGSNGRTAMGLLRTPLIIADEPGAWEVNGSELLYHAIVTGQGKPDSPLRAIFIGTLAPSLSGWWHDLVMAGEGPGRHVTFLQGRREKWSDLREAYRVNPLSRISEDQRKTLRRERDEALRDSRLKARYLSYRLNIPTANESTMLLTVADWERIAARPVPPREGRPIVAFDLGGGRAWSAAVGIWKNGRMEAIAVAPGIPSLEEQERRDRVSAGTYRRLAQTGALRVAEGLRVQPPAQLHEAVRAAWGRPEIILCDRFRLNELADCVNGTPLVPRLMRWSEASESIRALRKIAADGPLACEESSRLLVAASLSVAMVKNDDQGSVRLVKRGTNNTGRDDVAAALILASGAYVRAMGTPKPSWRYRGMVG